MGNMSGSYGSHYTLRLDAYVLSQDIGNNRSTIRADLYLDFDGSSYWASTNYTTYGSITINGNTSNKSISSISYSSGQAKSVYLGTHDVVVNHNDDGTCGAISISGSWNTDTSRIGSGSTSTAVTPSTIPRYAYFTTQPFLNNKSNTSLDIGYRPDRRLIHAEYRINNGSWNELNVISGAWDDPNSTTIFRISNLSANTSYNVQMRICQVENLWTESNIITVSTYPNTNPTISLSSKTVNSITVTSSCNVAVSSTEYRIKRGSGNYGNYQSSNTFTGLDPNTAYTIEVKKVSSAGGIIGTATLNVSTYDIARITSAPNLTFGNNYTINYSNPSGVSMETCIASLDGSTQYVLYRNCSGSSYTYNFTDSELDTLYKLFGQNNTITVRVYIRIIVNNVVYSDYPPITIIFDGNQKTSHININGNWKRAKRWINVNGTWKRAVRWINVNGTWKKCI